MISSGFKHDALLKRGAFAAAVLLGAVIAAVGAKFFLQLGLAWRCPMLVVLGIPCPSCGTTRAFAALAEIDFLSALKLNPLFALGLIAGPVLLFVQNVPEGLRRNGWFIFAGVAAVNWIYLMLFLPR